jgi:hypothetical protein
MKTFVTTIIIKTADSLNNRKPNVDMVKNYLQNVVAVRAVAESFFRCSVVMNIEDVKIQVQEID